MFAKDLGAVATVLEDIQSRIDGLVRGDVRYQYRATMEEMQDSGYDVDPEEEVATLPADPDKGPSAT